MRLSSESELKLLLKNSHIKISGSIPPPQKKKGRTGSNKVPLDGHLFDSQKEANIYLEFKHDPDIKILELQPKYIVKPEFKLRGKTYKAIKWTLDFRILDKGVEYVVDVKSVGTLRANSKSHPMRRKLFLDSYPEIILKEIVFDRKKRIENIY